MSNKIFLIIILIVAIGGTLFSGYLSYQNIFGEGCEDAVISCGPTPVEILGLPNCVYGFFMFVIITILSLIGLFRTRSQGIIKTTFILSIIGVLFAGYLTYYEFFSLGEGLGQLPACFYGGLLFLIILVVSWWGWRFSQKMSARETMDDRAAEGKEK